MDNANGPARLTFLISAEEKRAFDEVCAAQDLTSSQVMRRLIAAYLERHGRTAPKARQPPLQAAQS